MSLQRLNGKVAIVTGAARGVGAAIACALAREGASVVAVDVLIEPLDATVKSIQDKGHTITSIAADISTEKGNRGAVELAVHEYGGLDCLVANAAIQRFAKLADTESAVWDEV